VASDLPDAVARWNASAGAEKAEDNPTLTASGRPVAALYTSLDSTVSTPSEELDRLGLPGEFPFVRGITPQMYRDQPWVMGMYSGRASPAETNKRIKSLLQRGQGGFSIALDLPTQNGLDSDHPLAAGEVGKVGVPIDTIDDMVELLDGIELPRVSQIRTTANAIGPLAVALVVGAADVGGYRAGDFKMLLQNDVLKEYLARGTYIFPPRAGLQFSVDVIEYCARELPHWDTIEFCGYHIRDSGSSAVQELAIALSNGREYIDAALARGLAIDQFAHSVYLFLAAHIDILEEVSKFRAARRLWAHLMRDDYGSTSDETCAAKIFVYTLGSLQTAQEPLNNIARVAYQSLAAALGGVQTLATSSYDEAMRLPSDLAAKVGLRTQQILAYETGITRTADPLGGSYAIERMTDDLEQAVVAEMARIAEQGGALAALENGWLRQQIDDRAYETQLRIERNETTVVGVNRFVDETSGEQLEFVSESSDFEAEQIERLALARARRSWIDVEDRLSDVARAAQQQQNTIPAILAAVHSHATVGEICAALAGVWGYASTRQAGMRPATPNGTHS
jgi:methylmalonyl-CoA mutase, N-terminal domain